MVDKGTFDNGFIVTPASKKLDAEYYTAEDAQGVTEGLFSSGSVGHAALQAAQTDESIQSFSELSVNQLSDGIAQSFLAQTANGSPYGAQSSDTSGANDTQDSTIENGAGINITSKSVNDYGVGGGSGAQPNLISGAETSILAGVTSSVSASSNGFGVGSTTINADVGNSVQQVNNTSNNTTITQNSGDTHFIDIELPVADIGVLSGPTVIKAIVNTVEIDINQLLQTVNETTMTVQTVLNNIVEGTQGLLIQILQNLGEQVGDLQIILDNAIGQPLAELSPILSDLDQTIHSALKEIAAQGLDGLDGLDYTLSTLQDSLAAALGVSGDTPDADTDVAAGLDILPDTDIQTADAIANLGETIVNEIADDISLDLIEDIVGDIDTSTDLGLDILSGEDADDAPDESDVALGLDTDIVDLDALAVDIDVNLDPVEAVVGDIDIETALATDLLSDAADGYIDDASGGHDGETLASDIGDMVGAIAEPVLTPAIDVTSPTIIDVDINVDEAVAVLDNSIDNITGVVANELATETNGDLWSDSTLGETAGLFDDLTHCGDGGNLDIILPDPTSDITEGLGALDTQVNEVINLGGGLFG